MLSITYSWWVFAEMHVASDVCSAAFTEGRSGFCGCIFHVSDRVALPLNVPQSKQAVSSVWKEIFKKMIDCVRGFSPSLLLAAVY